LHVLSNVLSFVSRNVVSLADSTSVSFRGCVSMYHSREMNIYCICYVSHNVGAWVCSEAGMKCSEQQVLLSVQNTREILQIQGICFPVDAFEAISSIVSIGLSSVRTITKLSFLYCILLLTLRRMYILALRTSFVVAYS
jgi:hypothetical protein